ncbi:iron chelate uptake ABC transporter family permease subunit [Buchnera aphidicola (Formosaphis micheliae)]|uniref:iron chelate uptake ABC transporter family permease subunit n=1 Tax=Buchnera aphidicola TaxID=9 RepID=UPI0031CCCA25
MITELFLQGWLAGMLLTLVTGPLGSFIVWRRMTFLSDTLSHSSLLGLAGGIFFNINPFYMVLFLLLILSLFIVILEQDLYLSLDLILGIMTNSAVSLSMIIFNCISEKDRIDVSNYFFGNLLKITLFDVVMVAMIITIILLILYIYWNKILLCSINPELAIIEGVNIFKIRLIFMFITTLTIIIAIKLIGSLIITSLLIMPAAIAKRFSSSPEQMAILATIIGMFGMTSGIIISILFSFPISSSIVLSLLIFFVISYMIK